MSKKSITQKALDLIRGDTTTAVEREDKAKKETVSALMNEGVALGERGIGKVAAGGKTIISGINDIWDAGRLFDEAESIGQMEFRNWHTDLESWTQEATRRAKIKAMQRVFHSMPQKATTMAECSPAIQTVLVLGGLTEVGHRLGQEQSHAPQIPLNAFLSDLVNVEKWLTKMEPADAPVDLYYSNLAVETLREIERSTKPIADRHAIVERLLKEKEEA